MTSVIPTACHMPELRQPRLISEAMIRALIGSSDVSPRIDTWRRIYARLVDKAVYEYQAARNAILAQIAEANRSVEEMEREGRQLPIIRFTDHFENCINALNRCLKLISHIEAARPPKPIPRVNRRLLASYTKKLKAVRNTIEHLDKDIQRNALRDHQPIMLSLTEDETGATLGRHTIAFRDVAGAIRELRHIGVHFYRQD